MKNFTKPTNIFIFLVIFSLKSLTAQQLAFPSAKGAGAYTTGGRGGLVVHVTNLNATGPGSFADALTMTVPRTIVFDVSGVININPLLYIGPQSGNFTIAGQTAPEGGITIAGGRVYFAGVTNYIMRHIRFKGGFEADLQPNTGDGIGSASFSSVGEINDVMVDHVSFSFGKTMPTWTKQGDQDETIDNTTIQRCLFSETNKGLILGQDVDQPTYRTAGDITFSKNVFYNVRYRTPNLTGNHSAGNSFDIINNLTWNAQGRIIRGSGDMNINHLGNATYQRSITLNDENLNLYSQGWVPKIHTSGNIIYATSLGNLTNTLAEMNTDNTLSWKVFDFGGPNYGNQLPPNFFVSTPYPLKGATQTILNAAELRTTLPNEVGCNARLNADGSVSPNLDTHDAEYLQNILNDVMVSPLQNYSIDPISSVSRPNDFYVSNAHIPEIWFQANVPAGQNHNDIAPSGYTWLEEYLNQVDGPTVSIGAESVTISPNTATLNVPETIVLSKTFTPANTTNQNGVWTSSNESVATVNSDGTVTSIAQGEATITFTSNDGGFSDSSVITVTNIIIDVESINVTPSNLLLDLEENFQANVDFIPADATNQNGTWISSNPSIASVDTDGNITGLQEGNAIITFTSSDNPSLTGDVLVTVEDVFFGTYEFYNADTDQLIQLIEGDTSFDLNIIGDQVNFRSIPEGGDNNTDVESVLVEWTGIVSGEHIESVPIYAGMNSHNEFDFLPFTVIEGTYNFTITYYSQDGASGDIVARDTFSLTFFFDTAPVADAGLDQDICEGETVTLTASGGSNYLWSTGETTEVIEVNPIVTTTYSVTVSNDQGDEDTDEVTVTVNALPVADAGADQTICAGESITLTASGGTAYLWNNGETTASIDANPTTDTDYSVEVISNNCSSIDSVSVFVVSAPNLTVSSDIVIANGQSTTLTANGGDNYLWSTGETTASINVSPATTTTYTVSSLGSNNCSTSAEVTVMVIPVVTADAGTDTTICVGETVTLNATGGGSYLWNTGATSAELVVSPLVTTTYTVTVEDDFGYTDTDSVTIIVNETPDITISGDVVIITGESTTLTASGSDNYQWNTGDTTPTITVNPTITTAYTVISTAVGGCADIEQVTVTVIPEVIADAGEDVTICSGEIITLNASGGSIYLWDNGETSSSISVSPIITTTYTVTVEDDYGYTDTDSVTITVNEIPNISVSNDVTIMDGDSTTLTATGSDNYLWSTGETTPSIVVSPSVTTTYSVSSVGVGGCEDTKQVNVTVIPELIADAGEDTSICVGDSTTLNASGGISYTWNTGQTGSELTVSPAVTTTYTVTVEDSFGSSDTDSVTITVNEIPNISVSNDVTIMDGDSTTLTASGSDNYLWSTGETTPSIVVSPNVTTTYSVSSVGVGGCEDTKQVNVTVIPELIADAGEDTSICIGDSITLNASGGISYTWNTGQTGSELTVSPAVTTTYTVTVEDSFGSSDTDSVTITVNEIPNISVSNDVTIMDGDSTTLTASGSDNYLWSTGETTPSIVVSPSVTTTYSVSSVGAGGCEDTKQVNVTVIPELIADAGEDTSICVGDSTTLNASGGISYTWNTGQTGSELTVSPTVTTTYTVTVEDSFGSSDTDSVTITVNEIPNISVSNDVTIMDGDSTTLTASGSDNYLWSTGETTPSIVVSPSVTTTYSVSSVGVGGCEDTKQVNVTVIPELIADAGEDTSICVGDSITLNASGGISYTWNTGQTGSELTVSPTVTTTYSVTVEDSFGSSDTDSVTITVNEMPIIEISENITIVQGESIDLFIIGAQSYLWNTGETSNSITVSPTETTTYTVLATSNTCSVQAQVTVTVEAVFQASAGEDERLCANDIYEVVLTANQGDSYIWNTGETSRSITVSPQSTSTYVVTVTKGVQSDTDNVTVHVDPNPEVVILNGDSIDIMNGDFVTLSATGANSYEWSNGTTQPNIAVSPRVTTTYQVTGYVGDCSDQKQITVNVIPEVIADAGEDVTICLDEVTTLTATGGEDYVWSTGETTQSIQVSPDVTTEYTVTVFNALDFDEDSVIVEVDLDCGADDGDNPTEGVQQDFDFDIFPNPASNFVNIRLTGSNILTHVYLYDMTGKLIYSTRISNESMSDSSITKINIREFESGIYYIKLVDINRELTKKLIIK